MFITKLYFYLTYYYIIKIGDNMNTHLYRKITIISFNNKRFQVFRDEKGKYAFLELDNEDKFHYPQLEDFIGLANIFSRDISHEALFEKSDNRKKKNSRNRLKFAASVIAASSIIACSSVLLSELQNTNQLSNNQIQDVISVSVDYGIEKDIETDYINNIPSIEPESIIPKEETNSESDFLSSSTQESINEITDDMYYVYDNNIEIDIYNSRALNKFLGEKQITLEDITDAVNSNSKIKNDLKPVIIDFAKQIMETYPNVDMRLFYENINRIDFKYETQEEINKHGGQLAWYDWYERAIHINENIDLSPGSYDLMVLRHELCHVISLGRFYTDNGKIIRELIKDGNYGTYIQEAVAVLISTYPFEDEYNFTDLGYGPLGNQMRAVAEAIPNFDMSIVANQNVYAMEKYFDANIDSDIDARRFFDILESETIIYYNIGYVQMNSNDVDSGYKYIADAYKQNVLRPDMSYDEIMEIQNNLVELLKRDSNLSTNMVRTNIIEQEFANYMNEHNITNSYTK